MCRTIFRKANPGHRISFLGKALGESICVSKKRVDLQSWNMFLGLLFEIILTQATVAIRRILENKRP